MDHLTKEKRSWNMSQIRSKETKPEIIFRKLIHREGFRYRLYVQNLPGKPDLVLKKYKTVVFIHGCFWHGHKDCRRASKPKTHKKYWYAKIEGNIARDKENKKKLRKAGWKVFTVWECKLKNLKTVLKKFKTFIEMV
jgi:DNA mismatch endonuclease (patch repair protein)